MNDFGDLSNIMVSLMDALYISWFVKKMVPHMWLRTDGIFLKFFDVLMHFVSLQGILFTRNPKRETIY